MRESVEITRQRLAQDLKAAQAKTVPVVKKLGAYDPATGLSEIINPDGGIGYGINLSNTARPGDVMRVTQASGGVAALDNLNLPSKALSASSPRPFVSPDFSAYNGDIFSKDEPKKKKVKWELQGNATYNDVDDIYILTTQIPYQVGAICNRTRVKNPLFRFSFEFRIYGAGDFIGDGIAFSYVPSLIGNPGSELGVGILDDGFSLNIYALYGGGVVFRDRYGERYNSFPFPNVPSPNFQNAAISVGEDIVEVDINGNSFSVATPTPPPGYFLRLSAATGDDLANNEVRNLLFNGNPLSGL